MAKVYEDEYTGRRVPHPVLNLLRCIACKNWLSCGPVLVLSTGESVCGRCHRSFSNGPLRKSRHYAYEVLAAQFKFPCRYWPKNCKRLLSSDEVLDHEANCSYKSFCTTLCSHPTDAFRSKRELNIRDVIQLEVLSDNIMEHLTCNICGGFLSSLPVLVCGDGTSMCHRCCLRFGCSDAEVSQHAAFEVLVHQVIFPCVYHLRGCPQYRQFGEDMWRHEIECPYGNVYGRQSVSEGPVVPSAPALTPPSAGQKQRGVIETHSGHVYGTITPNAANLFAPSDLTLKRKEQGQFLSEFHKHREELEARWNRPSKSVEPEVFRFPEVHNAASSHSSLPTPTSTNPGNFKFPEPVTRNQTSSTSPTSRFLIDELKYLQYLRRAETPPPGYKNEHPSGSPRSPYLPKDPLTPPPRDSEYYEKRREKKKTEYSVY